MREITDVEYLTFQADELIKKELRDRISILEVEKWWMRDVLTQCRTRFTHGEHSEAISDPDHCMACLVEQALYAEVNK